MESAYDLNNQAVALLHNTAMSSSTSSPTITSQSRIQQDDARSSTNASAVVPDAAAAKSTTTLDLVDDAINHAIVCFRKALQHARGAISSSKDTTDGGTGGGVSKGYNTNNNSSSSSSSSSSCRLGLYPIQKKNCHQGILSLLTFKSKSSKKSKYYQQLLFTRLFTVDHRDDESSTKTVPPCCNSDSRSSCSDIAAATTRSPTTAAITSSGGNRGGGNRCTSSSSCRSVLPHATIIFNLATIYMVISIFGGVHYQEQQQQEEAQRTTHHHRHNTTSSIDTKRLLYQSYKLYQCCWKMLHIRDSLLTSDIEGQQHRESQTERDEVLFDLMLLACLNNMMYVSNELGQYDHIAYYQHCKQLISLLSSTSSNNTGGTNRQKRLQSLSFSFSSILEGTTYNNPTRVMGGGGSSTFVDVDPTFSVVVAAEEEEEEEEKEEPSSNELDIVNDAKKELDQLISNLRRMYSIFGLLTTKIAPAA